MTPTIVFPNSEEALWATRPEYLDDDHKLVATIGGFLIESGDRKVIVDLPFGQTRLPPDSPP